MYCCLCCVCCEGDGNAGVGSGGGVVTVSACMSVTHGSGVLSSTDDVLEMSVVRGVGGVSGMCMCLSYTCICSFTTHMQISSRFRKPNLTPKAHTQST